MCSTRVARGKLQSGRRKGSGGGEVRQSPTELRIRRRWKGTTHLHHISSHHTPHHDNKRYHQLDDRFSFSSSVKFLLLQDDDGVYKNILSLSFSLNLIQSLCALPLFFQNQPFPQSIYSLCSHLFPSPNYYGKLSRDIIGLLSFSMFISLSLSVPYIPFLLYH